MWIPTAWLVHIYSRQLKYEVRATLITDLHQKEKVFSYNTEKLTTVNYFLMFGFKEGKSHMHKNCQTSRKKKVLLRFPSDLS